MKAVRHARARRRRRLVVGPGQVCGQFAGHGVEVQWRVQVVPAEHLEGGQVVAVLRPREVGEADLARVPLAVVGDEEQVVGRPGLTLGGIGGGALLERHSAENAAQRDYG